MKETENKDAPETGKMLGVSLYEKMRDMLKSVTIYHVPYDEWSKYALICKRYNIPKTYNIDMVTRWNKDCELLFSLADKYHCDPLTFKNDVLDAMLCMFSAMETNGMSDMIKKIVLDHNQNLSTMNKRFKDEMNSTITKNMEKTIKT